VQPKLVVLRYFVMLSGGTIACDREAIRMRVWCKFSMSGWRPTYSGNPALRKPSSRGLSAGQDCVRSYENVR
jgi:hypothetical protein